MLFKLRVDDGDDIETKIKNKRFEISRTKIAISMLKVNNTIYKSRLYNEIINNPFYSRYKKGIIKKQFQDLENY